MIVRMVVTGAGFLMVAEKSTVCAVCGDDGDGAHDHVGYNIANQNIGSSSSSSSSSSNEHCQATHTRPHPFFFFPINPVSSLRNSFLRIHHLTPPVYPLHTDAY